MPQLSVRAYSPVTHHVSHLLGEMIAVARRQRHMTASDLAKRAGISRTTLRKIETGDLKCEMGLVFEVATLVGVHLFEGDSRTLDLIQENLQAKLTLLPHRIRLQTKEVDDEF